MHSVIALKQNSKQPIIIKLHSHGQPDLYGMLTCHRVVSKSVYYSTMYQSEPPFIINCLPAAFLQHPGRYTVELSVTDPPPTVLSPFAVELSSVPHAANKGMVQTQDTQLTDCAV